MLMVAKTAVTSLTNMAGATGSCATVVHTLTQYGL